MNEESKSGKEQESKSGMKMNDEGKSGREE